MNVLEGVEIEGQEVQVQEFVNLSVQIANLAQLMEKLQTQIETNYRQMKRAEIRAILLNNKTLKQQLSQQLDSTKKMAVRVEQKLQKIRAAFSNKPK